MTNPRSRSPSINRSQVLGLRLTDEENKRYTELWAKVKKKYPYITKSDLNREIVGLSKNLVLTDADIRYFKTGYR